MGAFYFERENKETSLTQKLHINNGCLNINITFSYLTTTLIKLYYTFSYLETI